MKKILIALALSVSVAAKAAILSTNPLAGAAVAYLPTVAGGGAVLSYILMTSSTTNTGILNVYDTTNPGLTNIVPAYTTVTTYATNHVLAPYTNYYGVSITNWFMNTNPITYLVQVTNTVARVTNTLLPVLTITCATNAMTEVYLPNTVFQKGVTVQNGNANGAIGVTIGYTQ
jgi:hypothetical protein